MSMVVTDEERYWRGEPDRGADLKETDYGRFHQNSPYMGFSAAADPWDRSH
jgi:hypothetical protein